MLGWTKPLHCKGTTGFVFRNPQAFEEENALPLPLGCLRQHVANYRFETRMVIEVQANERRKIDSKQTLTNGEAHDCKAPRTGTFRQTLPSPEADVAARPRTVALLHEFTVGA